MLGRGICEKYQSRDEKFPEPIGDWNLVSRLVFFANTPPNMIYLFNYTEYYLEHFTSEHFRISNVNDHVTLRIKIEKKYSEWI
jgi:hypothetical protein